MKELNNFDLITKKDAFSILDNLVFNYDQQLKKQPNTPSMINLSVGNPDITPNTVWTNKLSHYVKNPNMHGYAKFNFRINNTLKKKFSLYHQRRFCKQGNIPTLNYKEEVLDLLGSKEGIFYSLFSILKPGNKILIPDPSYPVYNSIAELLSVEVILFNIRENGDPDLTAINKQDAVATNILILCSPGNPTAHVLSEDYLKEVIAFCHEYDILLLLDMAYAQIAYDHNLRPASVLALEGGKEIAIELHSLSKSCSLAGWRIGFVAGNKRIINKISQVKSNIDFGMFLPMQMVASEILDELENESERYKNIYEERLSFWISSMQEAGWIIPKPKAGFFLWTKLPQKFHNKRDDISFVQELLKETGVLITPGSGFGPAGSGYVRIALVQEMAQLKIASKRIQAWLNS